MPKNKNNRIAVQLPLPGFLICRKCNILKTYDELCKNKDRKDGVENLCKNCKNAYWRKDRQKYPDKNKAKQAIWRENNRDRIRVYGKQYAKTHRETWNEMRRKWAKNKPEAERTRKKRREYRKRNAEGTFTQEDLRIQYAMQNGKCAYCSISIGDDPTIDHIIPIARGGTNNPVNLVYACRKCNASKKNRLLFTEWIPKNPIMGLFHD